MIYYFCSAPSREKRLIIYGNNLVGSLLFILSLILLSAAFNILFFQPYTAIHILFGCAVAFIFLLIFQLVFLWIYDDILSNMPADTQNDGDTSILIGQLQNRTLNGLSVLRTMSQEQKSIQDRIDILYQKRSMEQQKSNTYIDNKIINNLVVTAQQNMDNTLKTLISTEKNSQLGILDQELTNLQNQIQQKDQKVTSLQQSINNTIIPNLNNRDLTAKIQFLGNPSYIKEIQYLKEQHHLYGLPKTIPDNYNRTFSAFYNDEIYWPNQEDNLNYVLMNQKNISLFAQETILLDQLNYYYGNQILSNISGLITPMKNISYKIINGNIIIYIYDLILVYNSTRNELIIYQKAQHGIYVCNERGIYNLPHTFYNFAQQKKCTYNYNLESKTYILTEEPLESTSPVFSKLMITNQLHKLQYFSLIGTEQINNITLSSINIPIGPCSFLKHMVVYQTDSNNLLILELDVTTRKITKFSQGNMSATSNFI